VDIPDSMKRIMRHLRRSTNPDNQARLSGYVGYERMITRPPATPDQVTRTPRLR
jgi:hypothetical protein